MNNQPTKDLTPEELDRCLKARDISKEDFRVLKDVIYTNAQSSKTVLLVIDYCKARKLDPMKKPVEIVPVWSKETNKLEDTLWTSIKELRTTAFRTGQYAGMDAPVFGKTITKKMNNVSVTFPEFCSVTVYRIINSQRCPFSIPVYWEETFSAKKGGEPNSMWLKRPIGQIIKCAEAASLRAAFPEEIGSEYIPEEAFSPNSMRDVTPRDNSDLQEAFKKNTEPQKLEKQEVAQQSILDELISNKPQKETITVKIGDEELPEIVCGSVQEAAKNILGYLDTIGDPKEKQMAKGYINTENKKLISQIKDVDPQAAKKIEP